MCDDEYGQRVGEGLGISADDVRGLPPLASQTLSDAELERARNLGNNGPRNVEGLTMTHCVPNEHVALADDPDLVSADAPRRGQRAAEEHREGPAFAGPLALGGVGFGRGGAGRVR